MAKVAEQFVPWGYRAGTAMKCSKKRAARAKFLFFLLNQLPFRRYQGSRRGSC